MLNDPRSSPLRSLVTAAVNIPTHTQHSHTHTWYVIGPPKQVSQNLPTQNGQTLRSDQPSKYSNVIEYQLKNPIWPLDHSTRSLFSSQPLMTRLISVVWPTRPNQVHTILASLAQQPTIYTHPSNSLLLLDFAPINIMKLYSLNHPHLIFGLFAIVFIANYHHQRVLVASLLLLLFW